jgi:hypothetical protein
LTITRLGLSLALLALAIVSAIDAKGADTLGWLGKLDAGTLMLEVAASIVAISSALWLGALDRISFAKHRAHQAEAAAGSGAARGGSVREASAGRVEARARAHLGDAQPRPAATR